MVDLCILRVCRNNTMTNQRSTRYIAFLSNFRAHIIYPRGFVYIQISLVIGFVVGVSSVFVSLSPTVGSTWKKCKMTDISFKVKTLNKKYYLSLLVCNLCVIPFPDRRGRFVCFNDGHMIFLHSFTLFTDQMFVFACIMIYCGKVLYWWD